MRQFLNIDQEPIIYESLYKLVHDKAMKTDRILTGWEKIILCNGIPSKFETYMVELLARIIELWVTIRGHSFTKVWNMKFEKRKYQEGTRKTIQRQREN